MDGNIDDIANDNKEKKKPEEKKYIEESGIEINNTKKLKLILKIQKKSK